MLVRDADRTNNASQLGVTDDEKLVMMASLAMTCAALPAFAASEADCQAMWKKADANNDGVLSEQESLQYSAMMRVHDKPAS